MVVHSLFENAGPLKVSVGDESPGYMPWSAHGESWVGWCYPYPRPIQASSVMHWRDTHITNPGTCNIACTHASALISWQCVTPLHKTHTGVQYSMQPKQQQLQAFCLNSGTQPS